MPDIDYSTITRVIWLSTAGAAAIAITATSTIYVAHARMTARIATKNLASLVTGFALAVMCVICWTLQFALIRLQLPQRTDGDQFSVDMVFIDLGYLPRIIPLIAILLTWFLLRRLKVGVE
jgi:hypothetical protein